MKTILEHLTEKNASPEFKPYDYDIEAEAEDAFFDCKILAWETVGDYQGDYFGLVEGPDGRIGFAKIGYGSCSGCDALIDAKSYGCSNREEFDKAFKETVELIQSWRDDTHWEADKAAMKAYLTGEKIDKEILESYLADDEKAKVWERLEAAVS